MVSSIAATLRLGLEQFNFQPYDGSSACIVLVGLIVERVVQSRFQQGDDSTQFRLALTQSWQVFGLLSAHKRFTLPEIIGACVVFFSIYQSCITPRSKSKHYSHLLSCTAAHIAMTVVKVVNSIILGRILEVACTGSKKAGPMMVMNTAALLVLSAVNLRWDWNHLSQVRRDKKRR